MSNEGELSAYLDQIKKFQMLDAEEEYMLAKLKTTGNIKSAETVTSHLRLVAKIAMVIKAIFAQMRSLKAKVNAM